MRRRRAAGYRVRHAVFRAFVGQFELNPRIDGEIAERQLPRRQALPRAVRQLYALFGKPADKVVFRGDRRHFQRVFLSLRDRDRGCFRLSFRLVVGQRVRLRDVFPFRVDCGVLRDPLRFEIKRLVQRLVFAPA